MKLIISKGKIVGETHQSELDFTSRLARIRASLERINRLMAELKAMSKDKKNEIKESEK